MGDKEGQIKNALEEFKIVSTTVEALNQKIVRNSEEISSRVENQLLEINNKLDILIQSVQNIPQFPNVDDISEKVSQSINGFLSEKVSQLIPESIKNANPTSQNDNLINNNSLKRLEESLERINSSQEYHKDKLQKIIDLNQNEFEALKRLAELLNKLHFENFK